MKKLLLTLGLVLMTVVSALAQVTSADVKFWVGTGSNEAILVVNWYGEAHVAWGYRWNTPADPGDVIYVAQMLEDIDDADDNLSIDGVSSGFVNDFEYDNLCLGLTDLSGYNSTETGYWMYAVNNVMAPMGVQGQELVNGDIIYWEYQIDWSQWGVTLDPNAVIEFPQDYSQRVYASLTDSVAYGNAYTANGFNIAASNIVMGSNTFSRSVQHTTCSADSTITLTLIAYQQTTPTTTINLTDNTCAGNAYTANGFNLPVQDNEGTFTYTRTSNDTAYVLTLTVNGIAEEYDTQIVCENDMPYTWNGQTYTEPGTYTWNGTTINGCDSVVTLYLMVAVSDTTYETASICQGSSYTWHDETYTTAGTYTVVTGVSSYGCPIVASLTLTVTPGFTSNDTVTISNSELPYLWNGQEITAPGTYTFNGTSSTGCDSIATLVLNVEAELDFADINWWVGTGTNEAMLILDFTFDSEAVAFGYRWNGNATVADMLQAFLDSCQGFEFAGLQNGFISSITYNDSVNGIYHDDVNAGVLGYWMYAVNNGYADAVNTQTINNGDIVYFEYHTDMENWDVIMPFDLAPVFPARPVQTGMDYATALDVTLSPVPAVDMLTINADKEMANIEIVAANGAVVMTEMLNANHATINVNSLSQGLYLLRATMTDGTRKAVRFIKK